MRIDRLGLTTVLALVVPALLVGGALVGSGALNWGQVCLLYTSDAADE